MADSSHTKPKKSRSDEETEEAKFHLQRRRVWRACESCRRKKIKCDGTEPVCAQCTSSGAPCVWLATKDRAALSRHYVQELEARLLHMETVYTQIAPAVDQLQSVEGPGSSSGSGSISPNAIASAADIVRSVTHRDSGGAINQTDSAFNHNGVRPSFKTEEDSLTLDEHGHMRWIGGSSTMSLIQNFRALTMESSTENEFAGPGPNKLYFPASVFFGKIDALPQAEEVEYPEQDLADNLVATYFARLHFLMPVVDSPSFMSKYRHLMANKHDIGWVRREAAFISLVFGVFACAARLLDDSRISPENSQDDGGSGMVYYERALILHYISHASTQISHVQSLVLMASFLCSVNCLPQAWLIVGQAVRIAQDLGLHRSPRKLHMPHIEKETRRKIFWNVYILDRMLALALGRPLGIDDADCDVEYPVDADDENLPAFFAGQSITPQPSLVAGMIALTSLYRISGRVLRQVYSLENCSDQLSKEKRAVLQHTVDSLDQELTQWCEELPVQFKSHSINEKQVSMGAVLCSHYYSVLTTLHRNFLPVRGDPPAAPRSPAKAVSSARSCIRLAPSIKNVIPTSHHLAFFIQHLFSSAVIIFLYAMHSTDPATAATAMTEGRTCLGALEAWEGHWPGARKCKELLSDLANNAEQAIMHSANRKANSIPAGAPGHERKRSITIQSHPVHGTGPVRPAKSKPRNMSRSRDPISTARRADFQSSTHRARSTSRKRAHDETTAEINPTTPSIYQTKFPGPARGSNSPHSSPQSVNHPSPGALEPALVPDEVSRSMPPHNTQYNNFSTGLPTSPLNANFEYDYSRSGNSPAATNQDQWIGPNNQWTDTTEQRGRALDIYPLGYTQQLTNSGYPSLYEQPLSPSDPAFYQAMASTPPTASFAANGLPFQWDPRFMANF